jgi:hypothetical protein
VLWATKAQLCWHAPPSRNRWGGEATVDTTVKVLENHAVQKGLAPQNLADFHQALVEAVQQGYDSYEDAR